MSQHPLYGKFIAAYIRVSSDQQDTTRQRQSIERWAKANGLKIAQWFEDSQGRNPRDRADRRLDFQRLLKLIRAGAFDAVVVDSQDRFGTKDAAQFWAFVSEMRDHGCELYSVAQGHLSGEDDASVMLGTVGALTSTREQKEKGLRSLSKRIETVRAGRWQGGHPPYGCDVVCCDTAGKEKWRLVWVGNFKRIKILPDGTEQPYDGKHNVPAHDIADVLRVQPSIRTDRLKVVRQIFHWYATEAISPHQIAVRLREASIDPVFRGGWEKQRIKELLKNPAYIGLPSMNKRGSARHWEWVDGEVRPVKAVKGKIKAGRTRKREDWIGPDQPVYPPIVSVDLYNKVQAKLARASQEYKAIVPRPRSPRVASFWLRNIAYCAGCGRPMRVWNMPYGENVYRSYFCSNYGQFGKKNPTGCGSNRIKAELLEGLVERYLGETQEKIARLLRRKADDPTESLTGEIGDKVQELNALAARMGALMKGHRHQEYGRRIKRAAQKIAKKKEGVSPIAVELVSKMELYRYVHKQRLPQLKKRFAELDKEHSGLVEKYVKLPAGRAVEKIKARIAKIEPEMNTLQASIENVADRFNDIARELIERGKTIQEIRKRVTTDAEYRRKTELVKSVISKAVCHFVPTEGQSKLRMTQFVRMDIEPQSGESVSFYPDGSSPARD